MIIDKATNFVYFSKQLLEKGVESEFKLTASILDKHKVNYGFLEGTVDNIWCRDYLPIQASEIKYVENKYNPDYLKPIKNRNLNTAPDLVCDSLGIKTTNQHYEDFTYCSLLSPGTTS
jgi:hypothetical protein